MSEFGSGVVIPLVKFTEHLNNRQYQVIRHQAQWGKMTKEEQDAWIKEAINYPVGDRARLLADIMVYKDEPDVGISHTIMMWMNGASDHFYDLDRDVAPVSLRELADLALEIGQGGRGLMGQETYGWETVKRIFDLWKKATLDIEEILASHHSYSYDWGDY